ncbi:multiprotein-bridging factor 1 family protein [Nocardia sp. NPDC057440]|uniref:helix-turn-helix domain-containing protein n=1 Tax=Nocardia sp. NPDC057440 TaxID=3346134 RepID=UPI00366DE657
MRSLILKERALATTLAQQEIRFRTNLIHYREKAGLTIDDVANKLGLDRKWVEEIEDLEVQPTLSQLRHYMLAIGVYTTFLIHG